MSKSHCNLAKTLLCSKKIIAKLLKPFQERLKENNMVLKEGTVQSVISKWKAKGLSPEQVLDLVYENNKLSPQERMKRLVEKKNEFLDGFLGELVGTMYKEYEKALREANSLDFDDLLVFGVKVFAKHKKAASWCQHVLVDE